MCQSELGVAAHAKKRLDAWVFEASVSYIRASLKTKAKAAGRKGIIRLSENKITLPPIFV